jgi:hypothetical protein
MRLVMRICMHAWPCALSISCAVCRRDGQRGRERFRALVSRLTNHAPPPPPPPILAHPSPCRPDGGRCQERHADRASALCPCARAGGGGARRRPCTHALGGGGRAHRRRHVPEPTRLRACGGCRGWRWRITAGRRGEAAGGRAGGGSAAARQTHAAGVHASRVSLYRRSCASTCRECRGGGCRSAAGCAASISRRAPSLRGPAATQCRACVTSCSLACVRVCNCARGAATGCVVPRGGSPGRWDGWRAQRRWRRQR